MNRDSVPTTFSCQCAGNRISIGDKAKSKYPFRKNRKIVRNRNARVIGDWTVNFIFAEVIMFTNG